MRSRITPLALAGILTLILAACSGTPATAPGTDTATAPTGAGHGAVTGAVELAEPRLGLTTIDQTGAVSHLDLLDESVSDLGTVGEPTAMTTDGRYLFAQTASGVEIIDSGVWTWDHVDHFHYYRADPRLLGTVTGAGAATIATTNLSTTGSTGLFFAESGEAVLLNTEALSKGEITERFRLTLAPGAGLVVPVGSFALVADGAAASVAGYTADGTPTGLDEPCVAPAGTITTRVRAVIGCADGALLASVKDDELTVERIPYPADVSVPAATAFHNREGRPTVAALAGTEGIWLLDTRARSWTLLPAPAPLVQVTAVDDADQHLLALTADGRLLVLNGADGSTIAETAPLVADSLAAGDTPVLLADQQRAYLSAPTERRLYEIDFADGARLARSFDTTTEPAFVAETGR
ncbi:ABC transporter [Cryobacterium arcticum]|uniref:Putative ABC transporter n=1 Tax=Cryobacterium arcticum TaxID=670052 RepID=A0A1B1BG27_9MICO|nr:ABC transporter [Cryobacterium arcticum]ANP71436.1 Putative ABC transporter [Cryobacterium arcticum]